MRLCIEVPLGAMGLCVASHFCASDIFGSSAFGTGLRVGTEATKVCSAEDCVASILWSANWTLGLAGSDIVRGCLTSPLALSAAAA